MACRAEGRFCMLCESSTMIYRAPGSALEAEQLTAPVPGRRLPPSVAIASGGGKHEAGRLVDSQHRLPRGARERRAVRGGRRQPDEARWGVEPVEGRPVLQCRGRRQPPLVRRVALPGGIHTVQLDPEVEQGRPYAYANAFEFGTTEVFVVNVLTGAVVGTYQSPEPQGCQPSEAQCDVFNSPHEGFLQRHPGSGRMLDYVSYWDSGLRIVDVTDPVHPVEVGSFDYSGLPGNCCAHYAAPTPSGDWVYQEDEIGTGGTGGVHVLDTHDCDGTRYCHPVQVGFWHINGHPVQAAAANGQGSGAINGVFQRYFTWDAHNLDVKGENTLLVANYTMGIRLVDTTDKTSPAETAFFQGRETWGAYFGSDGNIYASDFWLGFFIVKPS